LYSFLENFFKKGTFITYSEEEPSDESIRIWYQLNNQINEI
jgi:hypothetical protein